MRAYAVIAVSVLALGVSGCSYMPSWLGGPEKEKPHLAGKRIDAIPADASLQADESLKSKPVALPEASENTNWPQHGGMVAPAHGNLAAKGNFSKITKASIGDGDDFAHTLVPDPVVADGVVYAMDASGHVSAHDANDIEKIRWQSKGVSEKHVDDVLGGGLAFDQGKLFITSGRGLIVAIDAASGKELWRRMVRLPFRSAPRVSDGKLFAITIDNQLYALNTTSGEILWTHRGIDETAALLNFISPAPTAGAVIAPYSSGELYSLATNDGKELWNDSLAISKPTAANAVFSGIGGDPVIDDQVVFAVSSSGLLSVLYLPNGKHVWERPIASINTPWIAGNYLYVLSSDNTLICFVKFDGRIQWATKLPSYKDEKKKKDRITWRGPVMADGKLILVGSDGELLSVAGTDGKILATQEIPDDIYTAPVIAGGKLYLVGQNAKLYSLQ